MKPKPLTEKQITKQIRDLLKVCRVFHWANSGAWATPTGMKGVSDIIGIYDNKFLAIEVKGPKGKVSPDQQAFINRVKIEGGLAFVARSVEDVVEKLDLQVTLYPLFQNKAK